MENNFNNIPIEKFQFTKRNDLYHDSKFETKPVSYFQGAFQRFSKNKGAVVGGIVIAILVYVLEILIDNGFARMTWQTALKSGWLIAVVLGVLSLIALIYL